MTPELITAFGQFGPLGLMIAYLGMILRKPVLLVI